ncbi:hypothetical protein LNP00_01475 [Fructobacillus sp. M158]|uniref:TcpD family membrane protein n=1 Tax=Fructobacillus parabroussonetiae TaxID=2713174 RepID=UPI00200B0BE0|nr:TcpD family membrane protein [Fructobacillus parabroussonetiae]MCK8617042.1 hypothetical protein [Fructobacillus parabroussonetiae]
MPFYNSLKPLLLTAVFLVAAWRASIAYGKKETVQLWIIIGIGAVVYSFINDPSGTLATPGGIINALKQYLSGIGG